MVLGVEQMNASSIFNSADALIERLPAAYCAFDTRGRLVGCNESFVRRFGFAGKDEALSGFGALLPRFQPCGTPSADFLCQQIETARGLPGEYIFFELIVDNAAGTGMFISMTFENGYAVGFSGDFAASALASKRLIYDSIPLPASLWDEDIRMVDCNTAMLKFLGADKDRVMSRFFEYSTERQPCGTPTGQKVTEMLKEAFERGHAAYQWTHLVNGEIIPMEIIVVRVSTKDGLLAACYAVDQRESREAERRIQVMLDTAPLGVSLYDKDLRCVDCNDVKVSMLGIAHKNEYIDNLTTYITKPQIEGIARAFSDGHHRAELFIDKNNNEIIVDVTWHRVKSRGEFVVVEYMQDITENRMAAKKAMEAEEWGRLVMDSSPLAICVFDENLNSINCNDETLRMFRLENKEEYLAPGRTFLADVQPNGRNAAEVFDEHIKRALSRGHSRGELMCERIDGTLLPAAVEWVRIKYADKIMIVEYVQDLTRVYEANEFTQMVLDSAPMFVEMWDEDKNLTYCNRQTMVMLELSDPREFIDRYDEFSPKYQPCGTLSADLVAKIHEEAMATGFSRFEWTHLTSKGAVLPVETTFVRILREGKPAIVGYNHDLRPVKAAMQKERDAADLIQTLMDASPTCITLRDENGKFMYCNEQTLRLLGLRSAEEFISRFEELSPPYQPCGTPSGEMSKAMIKKALAEGVADFEWMHIKGSELVPVEAKFVRIMRNGKTGIIAYSHDLRAVKKALNEVREADERNKLMLDSTPLACFLFREVKDSDDEQNPAYKTIDCNKAALTLFGFKDKTEAIEDFSKIFPKKTGPYSYVGSMEYASRAMNDGFLQFEFDFVSMDGEGIPCKVTMVRINYKGEYILAGYIEDLRVIKAMVEEMKRIDIAEEESRAKTRFLARMSHEIRTPLSAIMGVTQIQLQNYSLVPDTEEAFLRIHSSGELLHKIINDILDLSKVEAGKMEIIPATYDTASLIVDTVQLNLMYMGSKRIEFRLRVDENLPSHMIGDEIRIKQILNNLLSNAFKYTHEGMISLAFDIERRESGDEIALVVTIEDTGQGMSQEQIDTLFEIEFTRFNVQYNRSIEGTGLGMSIAYQLLNMMNGDIKIKSTPGVGSTFTIRIPQKPDGSFVIGKEAATSLQNLEMTQKSMKRLARAEWEPMPYGSVLVVDDVESNLFVARGLLMPYKLKVETVDSGYAAIEKVKAGRVYDIIFMDHMMPFMDGIQAAQIIRGLGYERPIVALTANTIKGQSALFMNNGFSAFISKPIDVNILNSCLLRFIRDVQPAEVLEAAKSEALAPQSDDADNNDVQSNDADELLASFRRDALRALAAMEPVTNALLADDIVGGDALRAFQTQAHAMKAALANVGQKRLSEAASALESAAMRGDIAVIKNEGPAFLSALRDYAGGLSNTDFSDTDNGRTEDAETLRRHFDALLAACEAYDKKAAKACLRILRENAAAKDTKDLLDQLSAMLLHSDFEAVSRKIRGG